MRDLDVINSVAKSTKFIFTVSLIIPFFMGSGAWALADGAAPRLPLRENYLEILGLAIAAVALIALPIPYIFRWNWEAKYFGAGLFSLASGSIIGIYPVLCIAQYSLLPPLVRLVSVLLEVVIVTIWCSRFVKVYRGIYNDKKLFNYIYMEELTAVYYLQEGDKKVIDKLLKFNQFPSSKFVILPFLFAFSLIPFASSVSQIVGLPFIHVFLAIGAMPLNLMFLGLSTKMWLVYYFYPMKIRKETNKPVYVDMSSHPCKHASP